MRWCVTVVKPALCAWVCLSCDPFGTGFDAVEPAELASAHSLTPAPAAPDRLKVVTYNIKFGGARIDFFFDCHGDRVLMTRDEVLQNLSALAEEIRRLDPDILLLQEADRNSKRSAFVDQVTWLLDHTELNYAAYGSQWRADYVPSDGIGAVDSGNAILSRWHLVDAERVALDLRTDQSSLTRYFYLRRNLLRARIEFPERDSVWVVDTHTAAYSQDGTKRKHIERFTKELLALDERGSPVLGGGDLNALPPFSEKLRDFPDSVCTDEDFQADDYRGEETWLDSLYEHFEPAIELSQYADDNSPYFTHTTDAQGFYNRKLDYLFANKHFEDGLVHQGPDSGGAETMPLSDHAPLSATWVLAE